VHLNQTTNNLNTMSISTHSESPVNQLSEAAREAVNRAAEAAKETTHRAAVAAKEFTGAAEDVANEFTNSAKNAANRATDTAMDLCQSAALRAEETLATSKEYVRRNPVPVVLGAVAFGVAVGYLLMMARRKQTFSERYADEPLVAVREAILGALAPVTQRVHKGYDTAMDGAGKAIERVHSFGPGRSGDTFSDQIGRIGNNLKFW
jgi:ElaB/YqjD/DUF883 family membrane-anchored ribosome-binding protein